MNLKYDRLNSIEDFDQKIDQSINGTCFAYLWYLKLKNVKKIIKIIDKNELIGFMPLFLSKDTKNINQSTMYIPYGGPVLFKLPSKNSKKISYIKKINKLLSKKLKEDYDNFNFSIDGKIIDVMEYIREGIFPEVRYTYKLNLSNEEEVLKNLRKDRKRDLSKAISKKIEIALDKELQYYDFQKSIEWEKKYNLPSSELYVKKYISTAIDKKRGMAFVAKLKGKVIGGVFISWDLKCAYIMYSYFDKKYDYGTITYIYIKIFKYLKKIGILEIDFEGSVYSTVEDFNISFGTYQERFYNLHYYKDTTKYLNIYSYYEK